MKRSAVKTAYRILIMALVLLMVPVLCGCRQRITNNTEVINTINDEDGWLSENYQMRRDELSMPVAEPPLINTGSSGDDYDEYYGDDDDILSDFDMDDVDDDDRDQDDSKDKDKDKGGSKKPGGDTRSMITVTLDANGGKCSVKTIKVQKGGVYAGLPDANTATRKGYVLDGWYTEKDKGTKVSNGTKVTNNKAHTLYAHWKKPTAPTVTVEFDLYRSDAEFTSGGDPIEVQVGSHYGTLPKAVCDGYKFEGWYTDKKEGTKVTSKTKVENTSKHTLYAHWSRQEEPDPVKHTVTFDANGGEITSGSSTMEIAEGGTFKKLPTAARDGYKFEGWYTDPEGGDAVSGGDDFNFKEDITLYAHWSKEEAPEPEPVIHTVTFDPNGGEFTSGESTMDVEEGGKYGKLPTVVREGYTFEGWYTDPEGGDRVSGGDKFTATEDITLYAHWEYDPYTTWDNHFKEAANDVTEGAVCYMDDPDDSEKGLIESCKGSVEEDGEEPGYIVRFLKNFKNYSEEELESQAAGIYDAFREAHPDTDVTVLLVSDAAVKGSKEQKLWYKMALLQALHGSIDEDELDDAAEELGVDVYYPYIYTGGDGD